MCAGCFFYARQRAVQRGITARDLCRHEQPYALAFYASMAVPNRASGENVTACKCVGERRRGYMQQHHPICAKGGVRMMLTGLDMSRMASHSRPSKTF